MLQYSFKKGQYWFFKGGGLLYTFNWIIVDIVNVLQNLSRFDINDLVDNTAHKPLLHILAKCLWTIYLKRKETTQFWT